MLVRILVSLLNIDVQLSGARRVVVHPISQAGALEDANPVGLEHFEIFHTSLTKFHSNSSEVLKNNVNIPKNGQTERGRHTGNNRSCARAHTRCQQTVNKPVLLIVKTSVCIIIYPPSAARSHNTQNAPGLCEISI